MMTALELYDTALTSAARLEYVLDSEIRPAGLARWSSARAPGDDGILDRCVGPTLDIGCGPGRIAAALTHRGVPALGVDVSPVAVRLARARGAAALRRDVFGDVPAEGSWARTLLVDGNIGIGGDPIRLLHRCRRLLAARGHLLVEVDPPGSATRAASIRLRVGNRLSTRFAWAFVALPALAGFASAAGLAIEETWTEAERWFARLGISHDG